MPLWIDVQQDGDSRRVEVRRQAYHAYLNSISAYLPQSVKDFVLTEWYYSDSDKSPHDAWVEGFEIFEESTGERKQNRVIHIRVRLLSAYHKAHIVFEYKNVVGYHLGCPHQRAVPASDHGD